MLFLLMKLPKIFFMKNFEIVNIIFLQETVADMYLLCT